MRWQDYLILLLLAGAYAAYLVIGKRRFKNRGGRHNQQLTRREEMLLSRLKTEGYRLEEIHPGLPVTLKVDQKSRHFNYRGALTVHRGGKCYLVKIRRREITPLDSSVLRHELLLDYLFFQVDGILFYDPEKDRIQELFFRIGNGSRGLERWWLQIALVVLIALGAAVLCRLIGGGK